MYIELLIDIDDIGSGKYCDLSIAFTKAFLDSKIKEWEENKAYATKQLYQLIGFLARIDPILSIFDPCDW